MPIETELWQARIGTFQGGRMSRALLKQNITCTATSGTAPQGSSINWKEYRKASIIARCLMLALIIFCIYSVLKFKLPQCGDVEVNPGPTLGDKLTLDDLLQVHTLLYEARTTWFDIGLTLKVDNETLCSLRQKHYNDPSDCLREMLAVRLKSDDQLSLAMICACLREPIVGRTDVAQKIESTTLTESTKQVGGGTTACNTGTTAPSSAVSQSDVQGRKTTPAAQQVKKFVDRFFDLRIAAQKDLKKRVTVENLRLTVTTLPAVLSFEHDKFLKSKFRSFEKAKSIDGIFLHFNTYLSFLDFSLLEHIITRLCSKELKQQMEQYSEDMQSFRKEAMISDVIPFLPRPSKKISNDYSELDIELDIKTLRTLEDLDQHRRLCLGEFLLSRLAIHVHLKSIKEGSLCLSWLIPSDIIPALKSHLLKQNVLSFQELNILKLFVDKECLYPLPDKKRTSQEMENETAVPVPEIDNVVEERTVDDSGRLAQELLQASGEGDLQKVTELVSRGVGIDSRDEIGATPLHYASCFGHAMLANFLIDRGADIHAQLPDGTTPLYYACQEGHVEVADLFIKKGADLNLKRKDGTTPLYVASDLNHPEVVDLLLKSGADVNVKTNDGFTPLYYASSYNQPEVVDLLLKSGADVNVKTNSGATPLFIACQKGNIETANLLIKSGADVNLKREDGATPLFVASQEGNKETANLLIKSGADVNLKRESGATPLFIACQKGNIETANLLIKSGADVNLKLEDGATPLFVASQEGNKETANLLIKSGADVNLKREAGASPLIIASYNGHLVVVQMLLAHSADPNSKMEDGLTPLILAIKQQHSDIVKALLEKKADVAIRDEKTGWPALFHAANAGNLCIVEMLINNGSDVDIKDKNNATASDVALLNNHQEVSERILKQSRLKQQEKLSEEEKGQVKAKMQLYKKFFKALEDRLLPEKSRKKKHLSNKDSRIAERDNRSSDVNV